MLSNHSQAVPFDATNKEHRAAVRAFMKRYAWVDSPLRFTHDPNFGSIADQVKTKLLLWYIEQEDKKTGKGKLSDRIPRKIAENTDLPPEITAILESGQSPTGPVLVRVGEPK